MAALRHVIVLRVPPEDAKIIQDAATKDSRSVNQWARLKLLEAARK